METKMRIKLYDKSEYLMSDRLVEQQTEFNLGPKDKHEGPLSLELNLRDKEDAEKAIQYINKLIGNLPLQNKMKTVKITKGTLLEDNAEPLESLMETALRSFSQEKLITFLRNHNFRFIESDIITEFNEELKEKVNIKPIHHKFQFMIRLVKEAKNPLNDRYDHRLIFGIKLRGTKIEKVVVYLFGKFKTKKEIPWDNAKKINFKKVEKMVVFPAYMDYDERKKWRIEHRKVEIAQEREQEYKPSKFYTKNKPFIQFIGSKEKPKDAGIN